MDGRKALCLWPQPEAVCCSTHCAAAQALPEAREPLFYIISKAGCGAVQPGTAQTCLCPVRFNKGLFGVLSLRCCGIT